MKVVNVCLCGPFTDGWNYQENLLTKYQAINGNDVTVIASRWKWDNSGNLTITDNEDYINSDNVRIIRLSMIFRESMGNRLKKYKGLMDKLVDLKPDVIFVHGCQFRDSLTIIEYAKKYPVKIIVDNHADESNSANTWLSKNLLHKIFWRYHAKKLVPFTEIFYGVLPARVDFLVNMYKIPRNKCKLLVMGADDQLVDMASNKKNIENIRFKHDISDEDFLIITGGKIDLAKQQTLLLMDAVNEIKVSSVKLIVFGSVVKELEEEVTKRCSDRVKFIGWVSPDDSYLYFASSDLVVFPGRHSVFWEQVAGQGIPMIVKDWDGTHHIDLGGNVKFLKTNSKEEIYNVISNVLDNKDEFSHMKKIAFNKGKNKFSYKQIALESLSFNQ